MYQQRASVRQTYLRPSTRGRLKDQHLVVLLGARFTISEYTAYTCNVATFQPVFAADVLLAQLHCNSRLDEFCGSDAPSDLQPRPRSAAPARATNTNLFTR